MLFFNFFTLFLCYIVFFFIFAIEFMNIIY